MFYESLGQLPVTTCALWDNSAFTEGSCSMALLLNRSCPHFHLYAAYYIPKPVPRPLFSRNLCQFSQGGQLSHHTPKGHRTMISMLVTGTVWACLLVSKSGFPTNWTGLLGQR